MSIFDMYRCPCNNKVATTPYCPNCGTKKPDPVKHYRFEGQHRSPAGSTAIRTSEFRPPCKGEFYLSGASPMAYIAPNDLSTSYHIMHIVIPK